MNGLILADTKLEFGEVDGEVLVIDEMLTPDPSRYWAPTTSGHPRRVVRQAVRARPLPVDRLNMQPPSPHARERHRGHAEVRYVEAYEAITGESFDTWFANEE